MEFQKLKMLPDDIDRDEMISEMIEGIEEDIDYIGGVVAEDKEFARSKTVKDFFAGLQARVNAYNAIVEKKNEF